MNSATSLFDLFKKAETDDKYKRLVILAYRDNFGNDSSDDFDKARRWVDDWAKRNVGLRFKTCRQLVDYFNSFIYRIERNDDDDDDYDELDEMTEELRVELTP